MSVVYVYVHEECNVESPVACGLGKQNMLKRAKTLFLLPVDRCILSMLLGLGEQEINAPAVSGCVVIAWSDPLGTHFLWHGVAESLLSDNRIEI